MGLSFKENCPDMRNSKVFDLIKNLSEFNCQVDAYDPIVDEAEATKSLGGNFVTQPEANMYDAIVIAVSHQFFVELGIEKIKKYARPNHVLFDLKYTFKVNETDASL